MKRAYILNLTVLLLLIPLLMLATTYQAVSSYIISAQHQRMLIERQYFSITTIQDDLKNIADLSFRRAYLTLNEYVINNDFVNNASHVLEELMKYGTINGAPQSTMGNVTLEEWFINVKSYLNSLGMSIEPSDPDSFLKDHLEITIGPLDSFHIAVMLKVKNVTIVDSSGIVRYSGDIPPGEGDYIYSTISIVGFEDPFIVRKLNGLYTRVITPCKIPFPGEVYGYYDPSNPDDIENLALDWCYVGIPDNSSAGMYYPTILERFEGRIDPIQHRYYLTLAEMFKRKLGYTQELPVGLVTFLVPGPDTDPTLLGALTSLGVSVPDSYTSVSYYFLRCVIDNAECKSGEAVSDEYPSFKLDNATYSLIFGG
ncbi:hypothetical protein QDY65_00195 [Pyrococcus kukulkanii]|uniref:hypothetical protein n=1 Tax=Pyrococcus kukulkanii TaxID=1609559 RepID=UPI003569505F